MKNLFSLAIATFFTLSAWGQSSKFKAAQIILNNDEPKTGLVAAEFFVGAPKGLYFKAQENDKAEFLKIESIREVQITGAERYRAYCDSKTNNTCQWLQTLLQSQTSLYRSASDPELYYLEEDNKFSPIRNNSLSGLVNLMKQKCSGFNPPSNIGFNPQSLVNLVKSYDQCKNPQASEAKTMYRDFARSLYIGPKIGIDAGGVSVFEGSYYGFGGFSGGLTPGFGLSIQWQLGSKWSALTNLSYLSRTFSSDSINVWPVGEPNYSEVEMKLNFIDVPFYVQYQFSKGKFNPFVQAGIHAGVLLKGEIEEKMFEADEQELADQPRNKFRSPAFGYGLGLGFNFALSEKKRLQLLANYNQYAIPLASSSRLFEPSKQIKPVIFPRMQVALGYLWRI
jgi:Outer membrane protein beta-barrel domain